jgi:hypothetical protein
VIHFLQNPLDRSFACTRIHRIFELLLRFLDLRETNVWLDKFLGKHVVRLNKLFPLLSCDEYQNDNSERDKSYEDVGLHYIITYIN